MLRSLVTNTLSLRSQRSAFGDYTYDFLGVECLARYKPFDIGADLEHYPDLGIFTIQGKTQFTNFSDQLPWRMSKVSE